MNPAPVADGFDDEREDQQTRVIQGEKWQFTNDLIWVNSDEEEIPPDREVVVVNIARVLQKWIEQQPVAGATRFLVPGEKTPDIEQLNEACPRSEWSEDLTGSHEVRGNFRTSSTWSTYRPCRNRRIRPTRSGETSALTSLKTRSS